MLLAFIGATEEPHDSKLDPIPEKIFCSVLKLSWQIETESVVKM